MFLKQVVRLGSLTVILISLLLTSCVQLAGSVAAEVYFNNGVALADQGDLDGAIAAYDKAIALDPQFAWAYYKRGETYKRRAGSYHAPLDYSRAIADFDQAIALDPELTLAYIDRGIVYSRLDLLELAIADYTQAITIDPSNAGLIQLRGLAYYDNNERTKALLDFQRAQGLGYDLIDSARIKLDILIEEFEQ